MQKCLASWLAVAIATLTVVAPASAARAAGVSGRRAHAQSAALTLAPVLTGLNEPLFVGHAGDGTNRLYVVQRGGRILAYSSPDTVARRTTFLDISSRVLGGGERGLLGLAFHPRYAEDGRVFVAYTAKDGANTVSSFRVPPDAGQPSRRADRADAASEQVLFSLPDRAPNHNGGMLAFGPDGYLYVGTGDEGGTNDQYGNAQDLGSLFGKLLRVDVDGGDPYGIPASNPFVGRDGARPEIWAYGLRNPWRYSFDRATGDLYIGDAGQWAKEEVDFQPAGSAGGENYGWSRMEGSVCRDSSACDREGLTLPVAEYGRDLGVAVVGGYVYRGASSPAWDGAYVFGDYGSGRIWSLRRGEDGTWSRAELLDGKRRISSFGEDEAGELYLTDLAEGRVYRLGFTAA